MTPQTPNRQRNGLRLGLRITLAAVLVVLLGAIIWRAADRGQFSSAAAPTAPESTVATPAVETGQPTPTFTTSSPPPQAPAPAPVAPNPNPAPQTTEPPALAVTSFSASPTTIPCTTLSTADPGNSYVDFSWSSTGAVDAWIGVNTADAQIAPYANVPTTGSYTIYYPCPEASISYTLTVVDADGKKDSSTVTVKNSET